MNLQPAVLETAALPVELRPFNDDAAGPRHHLICPDLSGLTPEAHTIRALPVRSNNKPTDSALQ